jgi:hypothetical protein
MDREISLETSIGLQIDGEEKNRLSLQKDGEQKNR